MSELWTTVAAVGGPVGAIAGGWYAARATRVAASITAEAQRQAAETAAGPEERLADLAVIQASVTRLDAENAQLRQRLTGMETLVRAFGRYVAHLTAQMRAHGLDPAEPPDRVEEYNRTGV
ncbi:hypothetical protein [Streptomyces specialis]|uniref:hypothetical protein n=1 Tax=Streptomyces specialis TaxID=498367 RepID=UPI00073F88C5|nr:hypothetical protein [Streptomyces specialis]